MKTSLKYFSLWIPFIYAMVASGIALFGWSQSTIRLPPGFPAFFSVSSHGFPFRGSKYAKPHFQIGEANLELGKAGRFENG
jgi:hypothetical protein